jgi:cytochrome b subunit of formate dehydrogenase
MAEDMTAPLVGDNETFVRMTGVARLQHLLNIVSFTVLLITGLPLVISGSGLFRALFGSARAFFIRGVVHRAAAVALIANLLWHVLYTVLTQEGREHFREMLPKAADVRAAVRTLGHNLGLAAFLERHRIFRRFFDRHPFWLFTEPPAIGRFGFIEKFEYWSLAWGSVVMIVSGFFLWDMSLSLRLFPLWVHDIFIIVHSYEAILAFLAILIWHMYTVHLNPEVFPMSRVWINGKITGRELRERHPLEYEKIMARRKRRLEEATAKAVAAGFPLPPG